MKRMMREQTTAIEVKPRWAERYHRWLMDSMEGTSFTMCSNYFKVENGRVVTQWPNGPLVYGFMAKVLGPPSETTRRIPVPRSDTDDGRARQIAFASTERGDVR